MLLAPKVAQWSKTCLSRIRTLHWKDRAWTMKSIAANTARFHSTFTLTTKQWPNSRSSRRKSKLSLYSNGTQAASKTSHLISWKEKPSSSDMQASQCMEMHIRTPLTSSISIHFKTCNSSSKETSWSCISIGRALRSCRTSSRAATKEVQVWPGIKAAGRTPNFKNKRSPNMSPW